MAGGRGPPKNSRNLKKKIYLEELYKFETLGPFKILLLGLDAAIPVPLPLLETMSNVFNRNAVKGHPQFSLNLCSISKSHPFKSGFIPGNKEKVTRRNIRRVA
jgi:hypothetical protein